MSSKTNTCAISKTITSKDVKKLEMEHHEQFYNMVFCLTMEYQDRGTKEFKKHFKKNMFVKPNTAGCIHVIHFLLNVLNPEEFKKKITWPIFDRRTESQFFMDVVKYVNDLGTNNEDSGLPNLTKSTFQSSCGIKFIKEMCKLAGFVLFQHLKRTEGENDSTLLPFKVTSTDKKLALEEVRKFEKISENQLEKLAIEQRDFDNNIKIVKNLASELENEKNLVDKRLLEAKRLLMETVEKCQIDAKELTKKIPDISTSKLIVEQKVKLLKIKEEIFKKCSDLTDMINNKKNTTKIKSGSSQTNLVDYLCDYLNKFDLNKNEFNFGKKLDLSTELALVDENCKSLTETLNNYEKLNVQLLEFQMHLKKVINDDNNSRFEPSEDLFENIKLIFDPLFCTLDKIQF